MVQNLDVWVFGDFVLIVSERQMIISFANFMLAAVGYLPTNISH